MGLYISSSDIRVLGNPLVFFLLLLIFSKMPSTKNVHHAKAFRTLTIVDMSFGILS